MRRGTHKPGLVLGLILGLAGCAQLAQITGTPDVVVPSEGARVLQITVPGLAYRGFATPAARNGDVVTWETADGKSVSLRGGRLVATRGFGDDLMGSDAQPPRALGSGWTPRINSYMSGDYQSVFKTFQCRRTASPDLGEICTNDRLRFENSFRIAGDGTVTKSRQWVSRGLGHMEIERVVR